MRALSTHRATGWRLSDLSEETGLDHATAHRLLACLVDERFATRVAGTKRYTLGALAFELGLAAAPYFSIGHRVAPSLSRLALDTQATLFLNVRSGFDSVCVARHEGRRALKAFTVDVGTRRPLALSAGGVAMLVCLPRQEQDLIEAHNLRSIVRRGEARSTAVRRMLRRSRRAGLGLNLEDIIPGIVAIGVAIRSQDGAPAASLSLAAGGVDLDSRRRATIVDRLRSEATAIEAILPELRY